MAPPSHGTRPTRKGFARRRLPKGRPLSHAERLALAPRPPRGAQTRYLALIDWLDRQVRALAMRRLGPLLEELAPGFREDSAAAFLPARWVPSHGAWPCGTPLPDWYVRGLRVTKPWREIRQDAWVPKGSGRYTDALAALQGDIDSLMAEFEKPLAEVARDVVRHNVNQAPGLGGGATKHGSNVAEFVRRNVRLVKSVQAGQLQRLEEVLTGASSGGLGEAVRVEPLRAALEKEFNLTRARAALVARDQTLKLNSQITQERQRAAGVDTYIWTTARDERVRGRPGGLWAKSQSNHWVLDGTRQQWSKPPITNPVTGQRNHPGEDFQCRCVALPDVDRILNAPPPEPEAAPVQPDAPLPEFPGALPRTKVRDSGLAAPPPTPPATSKPVRYRLEASSGGAWYSVGGLFKSPAGAAKSYAAEARAFHAQPTRYRVVDSEGSIVAELPTVQPR